MTYLVCFDVYCEKGISVSEETNSNSDHNSTYDNVNRGSNSIVDVTQDDVKNDSAEKISVEEKSMRASHAKLETEGVESSKSKGFLKSSSRKFAIVLAISIILAVIVLGFATNVICFHDFKDATCDEPKTCSICGVTEGEPLGHTWQEATCETPKTCTVCGETTGYALEHDVEKWTVDRKATCSKEGARHGICTRCEEEIEESIPTLDHTEGKWKVEQDYQITSDGMVIPGTKALKCSVCGQTIRTEEYTTSVSTAQLNALKKASQYLDYTSFSRKGLIHQLEFEGFSSKDATFAVDHCGADWNEQAELKAADYMDYTSFSRKGLIHQLEFEGFTAKQAAHGADSVGL